MNKWLPMEPMTALSEPSPETFANFGVYLVDGASCLVGEVADGKKYRLEGRNWVVFEEPIDGRQ